MPKKIILVSNTSWSFYKFRRGLIQKLIRKEHQVFLLSPRDEHVEDLLQLGAEYVELHYMYAKGVNPKRDVECYRELKTNYKKLQPDIIFHYTIKPNIYGTYAAYKCKIKNIAVVTGLGFTFINNGIVPSIARSLYNLVLAKASRIWFLNEDDKNLFIDKKIVPQEKVDLLHGEGIDCDYFSPSGKTDKYKGSTEFLFIGRLLYDKGIREFYEAAKMLKQKYPEIIFSVLGYLHVKNPKAVDPNQFQQWIDEGTIQYYGSSPEVRTYARKCSCIVLPSYREGLSMVLLEGASMATPLIASNIAGCKEVIEHGKTGYVVNPKDAKDLAEKMKQFHLLSVEEKYNMGQSGRAKIEREFSSDIIFKMYNKTIEGE